MNNERILSHNMSQKLTLDEIENVSAAGPAAAAYATHIITGRGDLDILLDL